MADQATKELALRFGFAAVAAAFLMGIVYLVVSTSLVGPNQVLVVVSGNSMAPTFRDGEQFVLERSDEPRIGDIIIFRDGEQVGLQERNLVKRIAGLPGDTVTFTGDGLYVNGMRAYDLEANDYLCQNGELGEWKLGESEFFVLGDNTRNSTDSLAIFCRKGFEEAVVSEETVIAYGLKVRSFPW